MLSLLLYALSIDLLVPASAIEVLYARIFREGQPMPVEASHAQLVEKVRTALARDAYALGITVVFWGNMALLTGTVATEERRDQIEQIARECLCDFAVHNALRIQALEARLVRTSSARRGGMAP